MLLSSFVDTKYKKYLVNAILLCGAFHAIYAICQLYELFGVRIYTHTYRHFDETLNKMVSNTRIWAIGCTTNPNVFGVYMLICLSYSIGLFLDNKKIVIKIIYGLAIALFMFGIMISNCSSSVVGLSSIGIFLLVYCIKNKCFKQLLVVGLILISMVALAVKLNKTKLIRDVKKTANEVSQIVKGNSEDSFGTNRIFVWKETLNIVPKYLSHGVGIDNFYYAFNGRPLIYKYYSYDKVHNEYLQTLVTQGIFATISYIALYGYTLFYGIKNSFKKKEVYLVLPVLGYVVQAFFSISVIELAPIFYMALGICGHREKTKTYENTLPEIK